MKQRQKMQIEQLITNEFRKAKMYQMSIERIEADHCKPLQAADQIKTPLAVKSQAMRSSHCSAIKESAQKHRFVQSKISMPTQENSHLTWDFEPSKKQKMKMLNENFLLTSIKHNKNMSS